MTERAANARPTGYGALVWQQFRRSRLAVASLAFVGALMLIALLAPLVATDRPLLAKADPARQAPLVTYNGQAPVERTGWFSPALEALTRTDWILYAAIVWAAAALIFRALTVADDDPHREGRRIPRRTRNLILRGLFAAAALGCLALWFWGPTRTDERTDWNAVVANASSGDVFVRAPVPHRPEHQYLDDALKGPCARYWLGTDQVGRDVLSQLIHGARISLSIGFVAVGISSVIGAILGAIGGYFGGKADFWVMRFIEVMMCFPTLFLIITISVVVKERSIWTVMVIIGITSWTGAARLVRGEFLKQRAMEYVTAARAQGESSLRVMFRHILPNAMAPLLVTVTLGIAGAVTMESTLSFLSLGVPPEAPTWGRVLSSGLAYVRYAWWLATFPGIAIFVTVISYNLAGEGLRDAVDPRMRV